MTYQYQLKIELQVPSQSDDPDEVEARWRERLGFAGEEVSVEAEAILAGTDQVSEHLARYLTNTEKRTGQKWEVVERYRTIGPDYGRYGDGYDRALLRAEDGSTVRIYYRRWRQCWVRGQKVLAPKPTQ